MISSIVVSIHFSGHSSELYFQIELISSFTNFSLIVSNIVYYFWLHIYYRLVVVFNLWPDYNLFTKSLSVICSDDLVTLPSRYWFSSSIVASISSRVVGFCIVIIYFGYVYIIERRSYLVCALTCRRVCYTTAIHSCYTPFQV